MFGLAWFLLLDALPNASRFTLCTQSYLHGTSTFEVTVNSQSFKIKNGVLLLNDKCNQRCSIRRCSGITGRLTERIVCVCCRCAGTINTKNKQKINFLKCPMESLEVVDNFHYFSNQVSSDEGSSESMVATRRAWQSSESYYLCW